MEARLLKADEIECRVGQQTKDKSKYSVLLYKTSRTDMAILDEMYGPNGWMNEYHMVGNSLFCRIGVLVNSMWVFKESNGSESNIEAEKGQASDAFKRAGFMWGIGRELYSAPKIWLDSSINQYDLTVSEIGYNDKREINRLVIKSKGTVVYEMGKPQTKAAKAEPKIDSEQTVSTTTQKPQWQEFYDKLKELCPDATKLNPLLKSCGASRPSEINAFVYGQAEKMLREGIDERGYTAVERENWANEVSNG